MAMMNEKSEALRPAVTCETEVAGGMAQRLRVRTHTFAADLLPDSGGTDAAPGPHDYFDAALAACKALTATIYARKKGWPLERVETRVERDASQEVHGHYRLLVQVAFHGPLTDEQRARLYEIVGRCPVHKLMTTTEIAIETAPLDGDRP
jgi:putative redox protein